MAKARKEHAVQYTFIGHVEDGERPAEAPTVEQLRAYYTKAHSVLKKKARGENTNAVRADQILEAHNLMRPLTCQDKT
jgi:hypothetical protein